ncbi:hypothetical protein V8E53_006863 [Lactarius tabidus]
MTVPEKNIDRTSATFVEAKKKDKEMIERWIAEADSTILFATLFSAVGAVSLVESYKWLSPDNGGQTVNLLNATVNLLAQEINSNKTGVESIVAAGNQPFHRTFNVVVVNVLWFGSMVVCIGCAIAATLFQQWGRRYLSLTQGCDPALEREHVRYFLYNGIKKFRMHWAPQLLGMLLHTSVLLYCLGIIFFIIHIDWALAPLAVGYLCFCFSLYIIATVLPFFFLDCPFGTPFTPLTWRLYHLCMFGICLTLVIIFVPFLWTSWWEYLYGATKKHIDRACEGQKRSISDYAKAMDEISPA